MKVKIITDSAADLPIEIIQNYNIDVYPLYVNHGDKYYKDRQDLSPLELYEGMREGEEYTTSQVPVNDFVQGFKQYAQKGGSYLYIAFSSKLSGTYQSAKLAQKQVENDYPDFDLNIIDSRCASLGLGMVVYKTAIAANEIDNREKVVDIAKKYCNQMEHIFTVDDLEYLVRGGRISKTKAFVGSILNIKPILEVKEGKLLPLDKQRGRKKVFKKIIEIMEERGTDLGQQVIGISHGDDLEAAETIKGMIEDRFGCSKFIINTVGSVVGAHSGPGTLAVFFINENKK